MYMYIQFIQCSPQLWLTENNNLFINSFIHSFIILNRIKKIREIQGNDRCISRESIRVVVFSIKVKKIMETIVLQFSGRNMSIQWSK